MKELAQFYGADSLKCRVPYDHWGHCLGSFNIGSVDSGEPDPGDVEFLRQVATQLAFAIDHVRAYEEINWLLDRLARENAYLLAEIKVTYNFGDSVGTSQKFKPVQELAQAVAPTNTSVLIIGGNRYGQRTIGPAYSRTQSKAR